MSYTKHYNADKTMIEVSNSDGEIVERVVVTAERLASGYCDDVQDDAPVTATKKPRKSKSE